MNRLNQKPIVSALSAGDYVTAIVNGKVVRLEAAALLNQYGGPSGTLAPADADPEPAVPSWYFGTGPGNYTNLGINTTADIVLLVWDGTAWSTVEHTVDTATIESNVEAAVSAKVENINLKTKFRLSVSESGNLNVLSGTLSWSKLYLIDSESGKFVRLTDVDGDYANSSITLDTLSALYIDLVDFQNATNASDIQLKYKKWSLLSENEIVLGITNGITYEKDMYGAIFDIISNIKLYNFDSRIQSLEDKDIDGIINDVNLLYESEKALIDTTSMSVVDGDAKFDGDSILVLDGASKGIGLGQNYWEIRYPLDSNNWIEEPTSGIFNFSLNTSGGGNPALWALNKLNSYIGKTIKVSFKVKKISGDAGLIFLVGGFNSSDTIITTDSYVKYEYVFTVLNTYGDTRMMFFSGIGGVYSVADFSANVLISTKEIEDRVKLLENTLNVVDVNLSALPNFKYKGASLLNGNSIRLNVGLFGDSWTHLTESATECKYATYLSRLLREKYGNGGGGWFDFAGGSTPMNSVDPLDATVVKSGSITYFDETSDCLGVTISHAQFDVGATVSLNVLTNHTKLVIHYFGGTGYGSFRYQNDSDGWNTVDASISDGHQTIELSVSDSPHTLLFEILSGSVILLGVDMQRNSGISIHKLGNRGMDTTTMLAPNSNIWGNALLSLNLDTITILMGTNDKSAGFLPALVKSNLETFINRIKTVDEFMDICLISPSENKTTTTYDMIDYAIKQYEIAIEQGIPFLNLIPLFGSTEQIIEKGTFSTVSTVHPTIEGGKMIAEHIHKHLLI